MVGLDEEQVKAGLWPCIRKRTRLWRLWRLWRLLKREVEPPLDPEEYWRNTGEDEEGRQSDLKGEMGGLRER